MDDLQYFTVLQIMISTETRAGFADVYAEMKVQQQQTLYGEAKPNPVVA